jgi:hypothetical protein
MPDWGGTDILGSSGGGKGTAAAQGSNPAIDYLNALLAGGGAGGSGGGGMTPPLPHPGGADQTGYIHADPHWTPQQQQQYEQAINAPGGAGAAQQINDAAWQDYDRRRASASTAEKAYMDAYHKARADAATPATTKTTGNAVRDPITATWSILGTDGKWVHGVKQADLQAQLPDNLKEQYPDWWWGQYADKENQARRLELEATGFDAQRFAGMGATTTRYSPTNF